MSNDYEQLKSRYADSFWLLGHNVCEWEKKDLFLFLKKWEKQLQGESPYVYNKGVISIFCSYLLNDYSKKFGVIHDAEKKWSMREDLINIIDSSFTVRTDKSIVCDVPPTLDWSELSKKIHEIIGCNGRNRGS